MNGGSGVQGLQQGVGYDRRGGGFLFTKWAGGANSFNDVSGHGGLSQTMGH